MLTASSVAVGFKCFYCQFKPISISARYKQPSCSWFVSFFFVWRVAMAFCDIHKLFVDFASFQARYPGSLLVPLCPSEISKLFCAQMDYQSVVTLCFASFLCSIALRSCNMGNGHIQTWYYDCSAEQTDRGRRWILQGEWLLFELQSWNIQLKKWSLYISKTVYRNMLPIIMYIVGCNALLKSLITVI